LLARRFIVLVTLWLSGAPAFAAPSQVHLGWRGATDTTMAVTWRSTEPSGSVEFGADAGYGLVQPAVSIAYQGSYLHEAQLTGLSAGTTYHYRCGSASSWTADRTFTTGPQVDAIASFRFAAYGDSRTDDAARRRVRAAVADRSPAFSIDSGDLVEDGQIQSQWDAWFAAMEPLLATTPLMPTLGNHEASSPLYFRQFAMPRHEPSTPGYEDQAYYAFDYGNTHFIALSSEHAGGAGSAQYAWLEADLQAAAIDPAIRWTVVYFHRPPYSSGVHGSDLAVRAAWGALFETYGVDLVISGHDHHYERTTPQGSVVYVVSGGAGAPLRAVGSSAFTALARSTFHFVEIDVTAYELAIEARDADGNVFDAVTLTNAAPLATPVPDPDPDPLPDPVPVPVPDPGGGGATASAPQSSGGCGVGGGNVALSSLTLVVVALAGARRRRP